MGVGGSFLSYHMKNRYFQPFVCLDMLLSCAGAIVSLSKYVQYSAAGLLSIGHAPVSITLLYIKSQIIHKYNFRDVV